MSPEQVKQAVKRYNAAIQAGKVILHGADPRPGKMTAEQEKAQRDIVNAALALPEKFLHSPR